MKIILLPFLLWRMNTQPQVTVKPELPVRNCHPVIHQVKQQKHPTTRCYDIHWAGFRPGVRHEQTAHVFSAPIPDALQSSSSHKAYCYIGDSLFWLRKKTAALGLQMSLHNTLVSPKSSFHPTVPSGIAAKEGQKGKFSHWAVHLTIHIVNNGKHSEEAIIWLDFQVSFS